MLELTPAYGRDYKSKKDAIADWLAGKDFIVAATGQYANKQDLPEPVLLRYAKLTRVCVSQAGMLKVSENQVGY